MGIYDIAKTFHIKNLTFAHRYPIMLKVIENQETNHGILARAQRANDPPFM